MPPPFSAGAKPKAQAMPAVAVPIERIVAMCIATLVADNLPIAGR